MLKHSGKWRTSIFFGNNCHLQNKWFFFDNNKNAKLMEVSFPIWMYFYKNKVWQHNNQFNQVLSTSIKFQK